MTDLVHRHLSCIMFTDMVGYSALAQRDESLAIRQVAEQRALFRPIFAAHRGREIKSTGDGFLVEFASALEATRCAVELQRALRDRNAAVSPGERFQVRVGLHLGDIEVQEEDVFGDGVNVAARVQQCALPGGVCVSEAVAHQVRNKLDHPPHVGDALPGYRHEPSGDRARARRRRGAGGSVVRMGDRVRISVRLIHASSERALWSQTYKRDLRDVLALQDEVARAVATEVEAELTPGERAHLSSARAIDPEAYEAYLRGRYWWNTRTRDGLERALGYFRRAIEIDPTWGPGYAGLADVYLTLGGNAHVPPEDAYPKARAAALAAIELDETLAEAHQVLSGVMLYYDWDWPGSEREIRRALELDPNYARGWQTYAFYFVTLGRMEEALEAIRKARDLDPLSPRINANVGYFLYFARDYEAAERESKKTLDMEPLLSLWTLGGVYIQQSRPEEAIGAFEELDRRGEPGARAMLAYAHAMAGSGTEARRILAEVEGQAEFVDPMAIALAHAALGDLDQAFSWLERAYGERFLQGWRLQGEPEWDPIRDDPRFVDLLHRMGLEPGRPIALPPRLDNIGGYRRVWPEGGIYQTDAASGMNVPPGAPAAELVVEPKISGGLECGRPTVAGRLWMDRTPLMTGADACGPLSPFSLAAIQPPRVRRRLGRGGRRSRAGTFSRRGARCGGFGSVEGRGLPGRSGPRRSPRRWRLPRSPVDRMEGSPDRLMARGRRSFSSATR